MEPFDPDRFRPGMTLEELMPDPDRRDVALGGIAIVVEHAEEIYKANTLPSVDPRLRGSRPRWADVLEELSNGYTREEAATRLKIGIESVKSHVKNAKQALGTKTIAHTVAEAIRMGLID